MMGCVFSCSEALFNLPRTPQVKKFLSAADKKYVQVNLQLAP